MSVTHVARQQRLEPCAERSSIPLRSGSRLLRPREIGRSRGRSPSASKGGGEWGDRVMGRPYRRIDMGNHRCLIKASEHDVISSLPVC
ncbi:hypothetical protein A7982_12526 [Minicystis rosea]|nr:hypothetical protein A7982_12526 [Minicystis rosea]